MCSDPEAGSDLKAHRLCVSPTSRLESNKEKAKVRTKNTIYCSSAPGSPPASRATMYVQCMYRLTTDPLPSELGTSKAVQA